VSVAGNGMSPLILKKQYRFFNSAPVFGNFFCGRDCRDVFTPTCNSEKLQLSYPSSFRYFWL